MLILTGIHAQHVSTKGAYIVVASIGFQFTQNCLSGRPTNFEIAVQMRRIEREQLTSWEQVSDVLRFHQIKPWNCDISCFKNYAKVIKYLIKDADSDRHWCSTCFNKRGIYSGGKYWIPIHSELPFWASD